jgi:hypothetical protein
MGSDESKPVDNNPTYINGGDDLQKANLATLRSSGGKRNDRVESGAVMFYSGQAICDQYGNISRDGSDMTIRQNEFGGYVRTTNEYYGHQGNIGDQPFSIYKGSFDSFRPQITSDNTQKHAQDLQLPEKGRNTLPRQSKQDKTLNDRPRQSKRDETLNDRPRQSKQDKTLNTLPRQDNTSNALTQPQKVDMRKVKTFCKPFGQVFFAGSVTKNFPNKDRLSVLTGRDGKTYAVVTINGTFKSGAETKSSYKLTNSGYEKYQLPTKSIGYYKIIDFDSTRAAFIVGPN